MDLSKKLNFRGSPSENEDFYMVAKIKKENISQFKTDTNTDFSNLGDSSDKFFFLCLNQYTASNKKMFYRLYWSSDPDDFQYNPSQGILNQGSVKVSAKRNGSGGYNLMFRTKANGTQILPEPGVYKNFSVNMDRISGDENSLPVNFLTNENFNLPTMTTLYYSIPYRLTSISSSQFANTTTLSTSTNIDWVFRKITRDPAPASSTSGNTIPKPVSTGAPNYSNRIYNFVNVTSMDTSSGTAESYFNYGNVDYQYVSGLTTLEDFETDSEILTLESNDDLSKFPKKNGNFVLFESSSGPSTAVYYDKKITFGSGVSFYLNDKKYSRGLLGNDITTTINSGTPVELLLNLRNTENCFTTLPTNANFEEIFDIFLIPSENFAMFPGGYTINNPHVFPACSPDTSVGDGILTPESNTPPGLEFYTNFSRKPYDAEFVGTKANNYVDCTSTDTQADTLNTYKLALYKQIPNLFMFQFLNVLSSDTWTTKTMEKYPLIAEFYDDVDYLGTGSYPMTFFSWDNREQSRNAYVFDYCEPGEFCGFCFGNSKSGVNFCYADRQTRKRAVQTTSSKSLPPLASSPRATGTHTNPGNTSENAIIVSSVVLGLLLLVVIVLLVRFNEERKRQIY